MPCMPAAGLPCPDFRQEPAVTGNTRLSQWLERLLAGRKPELGEALSFVERGGADARKLLDRLHAASGRAQVVGVTGPPGSGKSTLTNELALHFAEQGRRVGVVAVDPSSPFTGGAVLGDRVRMNRAGGHERIFIRSAATRGFLGGLARTTYDFVRVLDAVGYDPIIVETVGIGQSEIDICKVAHTVVVIEAPGLGDSIQAMKAGVLEIASILCVNKADLPGTDAKFAQLRELSQYASEHTPGWELPVLKTEAGLGKGVPELAERIVAHRAYLEGSNRLPAIERERALSEIRAVLQAELVDRTVGLAARAGTLEGLVASVAERSRSAANAARALRRDYILREEDHG